MAMHIRVLDAAGTKLDGNLMCTTSSPEMYWESSEVVWKHAVSIWLTIRTNAAEQMSSAGSMFEHQIARAPFRTTKLDGNSMRTTLSPEIFGIIWSCTEAC